MDEGYNFYNLEASFKKFLIAGNFSSITLKNYLSDLRHFFGWLIFKLKVKTQKLKSEKESFNQLLNFIDVSLVTDYKDYLTANAIPIKTINRRLSTLRKFFSFCINQGWMKENPAKKISNIKYQIADSKNSKIEIFNQFKNDLQKEDLDEATIKSYLEVVREFLNL